MSMRDYGFDDYGLVLDSYDVGFVANKVLAKRREQYIKDRIPFDESEFEMFDLSNDDSVHEAQEVAERIIKSVTEFDGEFYKISAITGQEIYDDSIDSDADYVYYIPVPKYPSFFERAYADYNELITDFKTRYSEYLPEDFDYENNFRHIVGTYFG